MEGIKYGNGNGPIGSKEGTTPITNVVNPRTKKKTVTRRKHLQKVQPSIAAHIQLYNIVTDLQQQCANISFGQLFQISPKL